MVIFRREAAMYDTALHREDEKPENNPNDRDTEQAQDGVLQDIQRLREQVKDPQYKLFSQGLLDQQEKVDELRREVVKGPTNRENMTKRTTSWRSWTKPVPSWSTSR